MGCAIEAGCAAGATVIAPLRTTHSADQLDAAHSVVDDIAALIAAGVPG
jgi:hypothetical protein